MIRTFKYCFVYWLIIIGIIFSTIVIAKEAAAFTYVTNCPTVVYVKPSKSSKVLAKISKNTELDIIATKGKWSQIQGNTQKGFVLKKNISKKALKDNQSEKTSIESLQTKLVEKGYLDETFLTGEMNSSTKKAIRIFQLVNDIPLSDNLNKITKDRIINGGKPKSDLSKDPWFSSNIDAAFPRLRVARIINVSTGISIKIRRTGGIEHCEIETRTVLDTKKLKKLFNGKWSWATRPVVLISGGKYFAASVNGQPHSKGLNKKNKLGGIVCLHLNSSLTHGSKIENPNHQNNIDKIYNYWYTN